MSKANLFEGFVNEYPVSKTLRFSLIPVGKTLENIEKDGVLDCDEKRADDYKKVKKLLDEYYKNFIEEALIGIELDVQDLVEYENLYNIKSKSDKEKLDFEKVHDRLRKQIVRHLKSNEKYKTLFKKEVIENELVEFLEGRETDIELVKTFKGYATMFQGFWDARKNIFTDEAKSTAIAYRIVHDNLPRFISNKNIYEYKIKSAMENKLEEIGRNLKSRTGLQDICDIFDIEYFSKTVTQSGIELYNLILGGYSPDENTKIRGMNEAVHIYNQENKGSKIPVLKFLYKQILSDTNTFSFIADSFDCDNDVLEALRIFYDEFDNIILDQMTGAARLLRSVREYSLNGIYIRNDKTIADLSNVLFGNWSHIGNCMNAKYEEENPGKLTEKYLEKRKKYFDGFDSFSVEYIEVCIGEKITDKLGDKIDELIAAVRAAYSDAESLIRNPYEGRHLVNDNIAVKKIKLLLDTMKSLGTFIRFFAGTGKEPDKDELFYAELDRYIKVLDNLNSMYNKTRNYVTKKPYSTEKYKLNFDNAELLSGWDLNKETSKASVILKKDGLYYLGIMKKNNRKVFVNVPEAEEDSDCFEKMEYKLLPGPNKMLPKVFFAKSNIDYYAPSAEINRIYETGTFKKGDNFNLEDCHAIIDYFKESLDKNEDWKVFNFEFSDTSSYEDIGEFYKEVQQQGYKINFKRISSSYIDELVESGKLYLFQIYNKDFSKFSKGTENLHTMYWKALFDPPNLKNVIYKLNGDAEIFFRRKSITEEEKIVHPANVEVENKSEETKKDKPVSLFDYDIIKDRRFTVDKFQFHVPITMNFKAIDRKSDLNLRMRQAIKDCDDMHIIGIDRGERHLLYISVIDLEGNIVEQESMNIIKSEYNGKEHSVNYHNLLDDREGDRQKARQEWSTIENIKELKAGYMSQIVHKVTNLMMKYNAIVVLEDLNSGFKRGRQKVEKQVYQNFEKALIDKLNYYIDKKADVNEIAGLYKPLQLTKEFDSFKKLGKQSGALFYVPAWNTSKIDPTTGFVNLLSVRYESKEKAKSFIEKIKKISYVSDSCGKYYAFNLDFKDFTEKGEGTKTNWNVCSFGNRIYNARNKEGYFESKSIDLTESFGQLFSKYGVEKSEDMKDQILAIEDVDFYKSFMHLFKLMMQIRNSESNGIVDYLQSPVKNAKGEFFNSDNVIGNEAPENADANGAYNIARKGLWVVQQIKSLPDSQLNKVKLAMTNKEWISFAQKGK